MGFWLPEEPGSRRRRDRILALLFLLLSLALVARAARKSEGVLVRNREFGAQFVLRADPYFSPGRGHSIHGPYPPSFALVAAPLSLLPLRLARVLWAAAQVGALGSLFVLLRRRARLVAPALAPHAALLYAAALLLVSRYVLRDTSGGGGNGLYVCLAVAGLELSFSRRERWAGVPLGLSLVLKPNLLPLLLFFPLTRRWRTLASSLFCAALFFGLPALYYGPADYAGLTLRWAERVGAYATLEDLHRSELVPEAMPPEQNAMNQSLRAALHRLLCPPGDTGAPDVHLLETSPRTASWIARSAAILLALLALDTVRRARAPAGAPPTSSELLAALGLLPLCMLLSPITWKAHHATLLPFFFAVLLVVGAEPRRRARRAWLAGLCAYYVVCNLASEELAGRTAKTWLQAVSVVTWADVALLLATASLVRTARRREDRSRAATPTM